MAYSTAENPCRPEVFPNASNPGCVDSWTTTQPADKTSITAIRLTSSATYAPGDGFVFNIQMNVPEIEEGEIAWNSIAGAAVNANTNAPLNPNSPPKVGITATSAGIPLLIGKTLDQATDPAAVKVGDTLTYHLSVSNPDLVNRLIDGSDTLPAGLQFSSITADAGTPAVDPAKISYDATTRKITWTNLTIGSGRTYSWTVKATVRNGSSGDLVNDFTVDRGRATDNACASDPTTECVGVNVAGAELTVTKAVAGPGASFAQGPYSARVSCVADGATVVDQTVSLANDGSTATVPVPYGSTCTTVEPDDDGATNVAISPSAPVAIVSGTDAYAVTITNTYDVGRLVINKTLTGAGTNLARNSFTFDVLCTFETRTVHDDSVTLTRTAGQTALTSSPIGPLPIGAACTVTETDNGGADATPAPVSVIIVQNNAANTVTAQLTNEFSAGRISVAKDLAGAWAATGAEDGTVFTVLVTCQLETLNAGGAPVRGTVFSGLIDLKGGQTAAVTDTAGDPVDLPLGTRCFGTETEDGGATSVDVDHGSYSTGVEVVSGTPADPQALTITIVNTFDAGALVVAKSMTGVGASLAKPPFAFGVVCTFEGRVVHDGTLTLTPASGALGGTSAPVTPLPVDASCSVTETGTGGADSAPASVTVIVPAGTADPVRAELTNAYSAGTIAVTKKLTGRYASEQKDTDFTVRVVCEVPGTATPLVDRSMTLGGGETRTVTATDGTDLLLPVGALCFGDETDDGGADSSAVDHGSPATAVTVVAGNPSTVQPLSITATNRFDTSEAGDDEGAEPDDGDVKDQDDNLRGLLPDAGGPALWMLGIGLFGLIGGGVIVRRARKGSDVV